MLALGFFALRSTVSGAVNLSSATLVANLASFETGAAALELGKASVSAHGHNTSANFASTAPAINQSLP